MSKISKPPSQYLLENRIIFLAGEINTSSADYAISNLLVLNSIDKESDIRLYITSYGGSAYAGLAIYDCIQMIEAPVATFCLGPAFSMAAWILASGDFGKRYATPNSRILLHQAWIQTAGTTADIRVAAENIMELEKKMISILAYHTKKSFEEIDKSIQRDLWLNAEEAKEFGIIDHIVPLPKIEKV